MKVIGLVGSPVREGNTGKLVNEILAGASENGADVKLYNLTALDIKGCDACGTCHDSGKCATADGMQKIYEEILGSDAVVLGSPVYMWQMSAQTKLFVDRLTAFLKPDFSSRIAGKKLVLAFSQGSSNPEALKPYFESTAGLFYFLGFDVLDMVIAAGMDEAGVASRPELLEEARQIGKSL